MIAILEVMKSINNTFAVSDKAVHGTWTIENGELSLPFLRDGQYFLMESDNKSSWNDTVVHLYAEDEYNLADEVFTGWITPLNVPDAFIDVCNSISAYTAEQPKSAYVSESFGGYTYTKGTHANGTLMGWQDAYRDELKVWRKI